MEILKELKKEGYERCDYSEGMYGRAVLDDLIEKAFKLGQEFALSKTCAKDERFIYDCEECGKADVMNCINSKWFCDECIKSKRGEQ